MRVNDRRGMPATLFAVAALFLAVAAQQPAAAAPFTNTEADTSRFVTTPGGNEARYRVREQLAGVDFPNDAIGKTAKVDGRIVLDDKGAVVKDQSKFTVDLASLVSDKDRRDNFLRRSTLGTDSFPSATFVPTSVSGLRLPLAASGDVTFQMTGSLTVRAVTRPATWQVTAKVENGSIAGTAITKFTFADFELVKPKVRSVLSVDDNITLELDFRLVPEK